MPTLRPALWICLALLATVLAYAPGLRGTFEFDDFPNIVDNTALHVTTLDAAAWKEAIWSSPASDLQRPVSSLTFALNHYFGGLDPLPMKITNLAIHLFNGWLSYLLLCRILALARGEVREDERDRTLAAFVSALWLLHPINLTAVLFIVQREESLAQTFVLAGLLLYVAARDPRGAGRHALLWIGLPLCTAVGILAKESAALTPVYALILELTVLRFRNASPKELGAFYAIFLVAPALLGLAWMLPHALSPEAYAHRPFTLAQRLMTEPRVLLDYIAWILVPLPRFFSFFRDDYPFSTDLAHPWTTLPAIALVAVLIAGAWMLRRREPVVALGILWFFAAQALTATFFPLELVFEHRNYFASLALVLAAASVGAKLLEDARHDRIRRAIAAAALALTAFVLVIRANEWGDPVRLAVSEAALHPTSPRATYDLGRTYVILSGYRPESKNVDNAIEALETASRVPRASILPEVALITVATRTGRTVDDRWWDRIRAKLASRHPTVEDSSGVRSLTECQREGHCALDDKRMLAIYLAGLAHGPPDAAILYSYAIFAFNRLHDTTLALNLARDAVAASKDPQYRLNLVNFLLDLGRFDEASVELDALKKKTRLGNMAKDVAAAEARLRRARGGGD